MRDTRVGKKVKINFGAGKILEGTLSSKDDIGISVKTEDGECYSVPWEAIEPRMFTVIREDKDYYPKAA